MKRTRKLILLLTSMWIGVSVFGQSTVTISGGNTPFWEAPICGEGGDNNPPLAGSLARALFDAHAASVDQDQVFTITIDPSVSTINLDGMRGEICRRNLIIEGPIDALGNPTTTITGNSNGGRILGTKETADNIIFRNFIIDANNDVNNVITINGSSNVDIDNIRIINTGSGISNGIILSSDATEINLSNVTISSPENLGIQIQSSNNITLNNIEITNSNTNAILIQNGSDNVVMDMLTIIGTENHGINVVNSDNITVSNSSITETGNVISNFDSDVDITQGAINFSGVTTSSVLNNVIFNNLAHGIQIEGAGSGTLIQGNIVGLEADGRTLNKNFGHGILVTNSSSVTVGGINTVPGILDLGNLVSGNGNNDLIDTDRNFGANINAKVTGHGIELRTTSNSTVIGNFVGTDITGNTTVGTGGRELGNGLNGIYIHNSQNNTIGGIELGAENITGGNGFTNEGVFALTEPDDSGKRHGIQLDGEPGAGSPSTGNLVIGNVSGLGVDRTSPIPNGQDQLSVFRSSNNNTIGGCEDGEPNILANGPFGIFIQINSNDNTIIGNFIGQNEAGDAHPNTDGGIAIVNDSEGNQIGSISCGNQIANSLGNAIIVGGNGSIENTIINNIMTCNANGIDLSDDGNNEFASTPASAVSINLADSDENTINGFTPNETDIIDIYIADTCSTSSLPCQARNVVGASNGAAGLALVTTLNNVSENIAFVEERGEGGVWTLDLTDQTLIDAGVTFDNVIVIARDVDGNTSEFHRCISVTTCIPPDDVELSIDNLTLCEGETATITATIVQDQLADQNLGEFEEYVRILFRQEGTNLIEVERANDITTASSNFTIDEAGTYLIQVFHEDDETDCSLNSETFTIQTETPITGTTISLDGSDPLCEDEEDITFNVTSSATGSTFFWTVTEGDATFTSGRNGASVTIDAGSSDFTLSVIETSAAPFECEQSTVTAVFEINPLPETTVPIGLSPVCEGDIETYAVTGLSATSTFVWEVSGGATFDSNESSDNLEVTWGAFNGTITVTETSEFGCEGPSVETLVIVNTLPEPFEITGEDPVCAGDMIEYSAPDATSNYVWTQDGNSVGDGSNSITVLIPEAGETVLSVTETTAEGCIATNGIDTIITVNSRPIPVIDLGDQNICNTDDFSVSVVDQGTDIEFIWTSSTGEVINSRDNVINLPARETNVTISVRAENTVTSCLSSDTEVATADITIQFPPATPIIDGDREPTCLEPRTYDVTNPNLNSRYVWTYDDVHSGTPNSGDTSAVGESSVLINLESATARIIVTEISEFGCPSDESAPFNVTPVGCDPSPNIFVSGDSCFTEIISIEDRSLVDPNITVIDVLIVLSPGDTVRFEDINQGEVIMFEFPAPGLYTIIERVRLNDNSFSDEISETINILPLPELNDADVTGVRQICQGNEEIYEITNPDAESNYIWEISGSPTVLDETLETFRSIRFSPSSNDVNIRIIEDRIGCRDTLDFTVDVLETPERGTITGGGTFCESDSINLSIQNPVAGSTYDWTFDTDASGTSMANDTTMINLVYNSAGNRTITVIETNENGCFSVDSSFSTDVIIDPTPDTPVINSPTDVCEGEDIIISATVSGTVDFSWLSSVDVIDEDDVNPITISSPSAGTKDIQLFISVDGCPSDTAIEQYTVIAAPAAPSFTIEDEFCIGDTVIATISSSTYNPTSNYTWVPGNNNQLDLPEGEESFTNMNQETRFITLGPDFTLSLTEVPSGAVDCPSPMSTIESADVFPDLGDLIFNPDTTICSVATDERFFVSDLRWVNANRISVTANFNDGSSSDIDDEDGFNDEFFESGFNTIRTIPEGFENTPFILNVVAEVRTSDDRLCSTSDIDIEYFIPMSQLIDVTIDSLSFCEGDDANFVALVSGLGENEIPDSNFVWAYNADTLLTELGIINDNDTVFVQNVQNEDSIIVDFDPAQVTCVRSESILQDTLVLKVFEQPTVRPDVLVENDDDELESVLDEDEFGEEIFLVSTNPSNLTLSSELLNFDSLSTYNYTYFTIDEITGDTIMLPLITNPQGVFNEDNTALSGTNRFIDGVTERTVYITSTINANDTLICDATVPFKIVVNFMIDPPNFVCTTCETNEWIINDLDRFPEASVTIFNRWGSIVYESGNGGFEPWDGTLNGDGSKDLPTGTYFYIIELNDEDNERFDGPVSILR